MSENSILKQLREILGLSKNEAKIYYFILQDGIQDPAIMSKELDLPKSRIYENLAKLASKDILRKKGEKFGYEIIPPKEAIDVLTKRRKEDYIKMEVALGNISDYLDNIWTKNLSTEVSPGVELFPFSQSESIFLQDITNIRKRLFVAISSDVRVFDMRKSGNALGMAIGEGLDVRYLTNTEVFSNRLRLALQQFEPLKQGKFTLEVKFNPNLHISFVLIDKLVYLFFFGTESSLDALTLRTADKNLVRALEWKFLTLWE